MTFEELIAKSIDHAGAAEALLKLDAAAAEVEGGDIEFRHDREAATHATLAEAYARLASAVIVNRTSLHAANDQVAKRTPVS